MLALYTDKCHEPVGILIGGMNRGVPKHLGRLWCILNHFEIVCMLYCIIIVVESNCSWFMLSVGVVEPSVLEVLLWDVWKWSEHPAKEILFTYLRSERKWYFWALLNTWCLNMFGYATCLINVCLAGIKQAKLQTSRFRVTQLGNQRQHLQKNLWTAADRGIRRFLIRRQILPIEARYFW